MAELFCCQAIKPYRPLRLDHEGKFDRFMQWAKHASSDPSDSFLLNSNMEYAVQLVKQVNFGPKESTRYFAPAKGDSGFIEITENDLLEANFEKLNSYVSSQCQLLVSHVLITKLPLLAGSRTSNATRTTSSSKSTCIRRIPSTDTIGERILHAPPRTSICH